MPVRPSLVARPHLCRQPTSLTALLPLAVTQYYRPWTTPLTLTLWRSDGCAENLKAYCLKAVVLAFESRRVKVPQGVADIKAVVTLASTAGWLIGARKLKTTLRRQLPRS
jgi:hypothetical protein